MSNSPYNNEELILLCELKEKQASELIIANKKLAFQNKEKKKRAAELVIANKELVFQNSEKEKRAAELIIANKKLAFQNTEKENRAAELAVANKELAFQNKEKQDRADELVVANKKLAFELIEKINRNKEYSDLQIVADMQSTILDSLSDSIAVLDKDGVIMQVNQAWIKFGKENKLCSVLHCIGDNYIDIAEKASGEDKEAGQQIAAGIKGVENGTLPYFELEYACHSPNEKRWFKAEVASLLKKQGMGVVVMHINITERKKAEERTILSEQYYRALIENIHDAIVLVNANSETIYQSPMAERITGFTMADTKGKPVFEFIHPDDLQSCIDFFLKVFAEPGVAHQNQYRILHKNGNYIWIEGSIINLIHVESVKAFIINYREITQRIIAEDGLRKSYREVSDYKFALDESSIVSVTGAKGNITFANNNFCKISGYSFDELNGQSHRMVNSSLHSKEFFKDLWKTISQGKVWKGEVRNRAKNGTVYWVDATIVPFLDQDHKPFQYMAIRNDVTQRKKAELDLRELYESLELRVSERTAELITANKDLEAFSSTVSHDLRAPVRAVNSFAKIILQDYGEKMDPKEKELFAYIEDSGKRMGTIIDDLLKLAKYGKEKLKLELVNMTRLVDGIWLNLSHTTAHHAKLELQELLDVQVDMSMLEQVVVNLLSNAIKYSSKKDKPVISVWSEKTNENVTFYFKDNGAGFDMNNYDRLFGTFQRLHSQRDFEGTGVGLSLVKRIIEKHGGTVGAEAKVGEGAIFYFTLPSKALNQPHE